MSAPTPPRPPTAAESFFRVGYGCFGGLILRLAAIALVVVLADWRARDKYARREAERARASEAAVRLADEYAKDTDSDGRFARKPDGPLGENDVWGRPFRLTYRPGTFSDGLEVRSAGPDGEWNTWDDVVAARSSRISNAAIAREAGAGLLDAARDRLWGKQKDAEKKDNKEKK
jgi:hypothetical protein